MASQPALVSMPDDDLASAVPLSDLPPVATARHVASLLGTTEASLAQDRYLGKGLPWTRVGRRVRYLRSDVLEFLVSNRIRGTVR